MYLYVFLNVSVRSYLSVQSEKPQAAQRKTRVKPSCQGNLSNFPQLPCCICIQASKYSPKTSLLYLYPSFRNISTNILAEFESKHQNPVSSSYAVLVFKFQISFLHLPCCVCRQDAESLPKFITAVFLCMLETYVLHPPIILRSFFLTISEFELRP